MVDSSGGTGGGGSELSSGFFSGFSGGSQPAATAYRTFRSLVESADRKFARVRDSPAYAKERNPHCRRKVFKAYTRGAGGGGLRRWEIGDVASRIGQLYYAQYLRNSDVRFLVEAYVFYEAILSRGYFERGKKGGRCKELRFYARFVLVALLLNRRELVWTLVERFRALVDHCGVTFPETNFKEWRQVLQDISRFLKADAGFTTSSRPLRCTPMFDFHPSSSSHIARFQANRSLRLQEAILTSYHRNEVKFSELTLDTYRMSQCLEWELDGSIYQTNAGDSTDNSSFNDYSGASGAIKMKFSSDMADPSLPPNPRKSILYRPSVSHLIAVIAAICEELSPDSIMLLYISASGRVDQSVASQKYNPGASRNPSIANASRYKSDNPSSDDSPRSKDQRDTSASGLLLGSQGKRGLNWLYPSDLIPFTRSPLFLIIDSDNSHAFKALHGSDRGEPAVLLLSPRRSTPDAQFAASPTTNRSQFTLFLTSPLQAFCQLVGLSDVDQETCGNTEAVLSAALAKWEVILCSSVRLNPVYARVLLDPFLRRLITRFIFCRSALSLFRQGGSGEGEYLPECSPELPEAVSPESSAVQSGLRQVAECLGVAGCFRFSGEGSARRRELV
ncbi:unnamed protein product [Spirodela intermedia]|uniref:Uncharacterized protein n=1 Tax=Spirodela intermedia TaxID=51605 RepID=A0A7I8INY8_SPIIN|nr:unnamed protein product [Spirodela intermedia]CAA6658851.1 unnamed protein product [Spirodela intermedia]